MATRTTAHTFTDGGQHRNGRERANYPRDELMQTYPNINQSFMRSFAEKHGKDAADRVFSMLWKAHQELQKTEEGCRDLKHALSFFQTKLTRSKTKMNHLLSLSSRTGHPRELLSLQNIQQQGI